MTNPVTQQLVRQLKDASIAQFVTHWDDLEALVISVYRAQVATPHDAAHFIAIKRRLQAHYAHWQAPLEPYWRQTKIDGSPVQADPFAALLQVEQAQDFVDNWDAMQTLPAARQALNEWLVDKIGN